jgi:hypothetical protein
MKAMFHPDALGPMGSACTEIRLAGERFATERAALRGRMTLLRRSDEMLAALEEMNLRRVRLVPDVGVVRLAALVGDLPFDVHWPRMNRLSPTAAIDVVFDIQEGLLRSMRGAQSDDDVFLEMAS